MAVFVVILNEVLGPDGGRGAGICLFEGAIAVNHVGPSADYSLVSPPRPGALPIARVEKYARWTEPVSALFARFLEKCPEKFLATPFEGALQCKLLLGPELESATEFERLAITPGECLTEVRFDTRYRKVVAIGPATAGRSIRLALRTGLHVGLGWSDGPPVMSRPIDAVATHAGKGGMRYVVLDEVPWYSRLLAQHHLSLPAERKVVSAEIWRSFTAGSGAAAR